MNPVRVPMGWRIVRGTAATLLVAAFGIGAWQAFQAIGAQPIGHVSFTGPAGRVSPADLEAFAHSIEGASADRATLQAVREAAHRIAWVRDAVVRRRFPDAVEITLETYEPLARWGERELVSPRGEIFTADYGAPLPRFVGTPAAAPRMAAEYPGIVAALTPVGAAVSELRLSPRGAWQVVLDNGMLLELGRGDIAPRLEQFATAWPRLAAQGVEARHVDLRYGNGLAVQRVAAAPPPMTPARPKAARKP